jgi:hypothetical protein
VTLERLFCHVGQCTISIFILISFLAGGGESSSAAGQAAALPGVFQARGNETRSGKPVAPVHASPSSVNQRRLRIPIGAREQA